MGMLDDLARGPVRPIVPPAPPPAADLDGPPVGIEHTLLVEWRFDGKVLRGEFVHRVPTQAERRTIDRLVARALEGMPRASFSEDALYVLERDAWLAVCYGARVPKWFGIDANLDARLSDKLYEEGLAHLSRFLDRSGDPTPRPVAGAEAEP